MKQCRICKQFKELNLFYKLSKSRLHHGDGRDTRCKECVKKHARSFEYREGARIRDKQRAKDPKRIESQKRYRQSDKYKQVRKRAEKKYRKTKKGQKTHSRGLAFYRKTKKFKAAIERYRDKFPEKRTAQIRLMNAIARNEIKRPSQCSICSKNCVPEGHHPDYSEPLQVIWACKQCHTDFHWSQR